MSDYGLKIWNSNGSILLDTTDRITRLRYSNEVSSGETSSVILTDINIASSCEISIPIELNYGYCSHSVVRIGTKIKWEPITNYACESLVFSFLYT